MANGRLYSFLLATTLVVVAASDSDAITLRWTAPGDDGMTGTATEYDLRVSRDPITATNFGLATRLFAGQIPPAPGGTVQTWSFNGLTLGVDYYFAIRTADDRGNWSPMSNVARYAATLAADSPPLQFGFSNAFPNPARGATRFSVAMPQAGPLRVEVYDPAGRRVRELAAGTHAAGTSELMWNLADDQGRPLRAGTYLVRAQTREHDTLRRVTVIR
ncbi:MAG: T9SS type A sorting domain-containing protein [Candidatus Eisenbacteria bacterium]|uniref:T9SS type A sorting domain-containing protein n=1 Tax=Eiseniibacteriota bacterium TaxID=2212470 RepID=A0A538SED0_UNCEI|nr:MAG: T9SS type A sorting domain-containing protein [Candidatus Eisenbacteria bacterium]